jgi:hypothetical protein
MTINRWLEAACADAERRGLPDLRPLLRALANNTRLLRDADFNHSSLIELEMETKKRT